MKSNQQRKTWIEQRIKNPNKYKSIAERPNSALSNSLDEDDDDD
jgi:hypothetical protein